jgi:hypothetical protein
MAGPFAHRGGLNPKPTPSLSRHRCDGARAIRFKPPVVLKLPVITTDLGHAAFFQHRMLPERDMRCFVMLRFPWRMVSEIVVDLHEDEGAVACPRQGNV